MSAPTVRERARAIALAYLGPDDLPEVELLAGRIAEAFVAAQRDERERCAVAVDEFVGVKNNTVSAMLRALPEEPTP